MNDPLRLGVSAGSTRASCRRVDAMERWLNRPIRVQNIFSAWDEREAAIEYLFDELLPAIWAAGRVPMVTWEPFVPDPESTPPDVVRRIEAGEYDAYLDEWTRRLARRLDGSSTPADPQPRRVFVRFAHEMNGDWYPWSSAGETTAGDYVAAWRRIADAFDHQSVPSSQARLVWTVNHADATETPAETCYPGDEYVDWVGIDGFNWGASREWSAWQSPAAVFDEMVRRVRALTDKPLCVPEVACSTATSAGRDVARKSAWIADAFEYFRDSDVRLASWFDVDKETDWAVFGGERGDETATIAGRPCRAYSGFRTAVAETVAPCGSEPNESV